MRKFEQKQLIELAGTMKEANDMLAQLYQAGNQEVYREVLVNEQTAAISIGTRIDRMIETEKSKLSEEMIEFLNSIVRLLEEYCELLWNANNVESQMLLANSIRTLNSKIGRITEDLEKIPVRYEVVFLPYKASMWDCMETVWRAAMEDPDCDVYVIPIPYFDLDKDGNPSEGHCEFDLMPSYVPVTDFRTYSLEERRPDVVYVHNPYDQYNKVTSVHPDYYCSNLENYTDMLVYIPYFLMNEHLAETHSLLPAYVYADKIVLTGEKMADDIDESIPRDKFIMVGSPKAERMIWMELHKDELELPQGWREVIQDKKVVFYNVSISSMLKLKEKILSKVEEVFGIFEKREDVVLLYRPHPLIEATLKSMHPELLEEYQELVKRVKGMKNAIYDTNPDVGLSVAVADAYIGESSSSVVDMFRIVKKPILFLTEEKYYQPEVDEMMAERTSDVCRVGDDLWFVTHPMNMLCKYSLKDNTIEHVANVPEVANDGVYHYVNIVNYNNKLILVPYRGDSLCVYDMEKKSFRKDYYRNEYVNFCFGRTYVYEHYVFLTPINYPAIVRYDILTGEFEYYKDAIRKVYEMIPDAEQAAPFVWGVDSWGSEIYIASTMLNIVITFDMENGDYKIEKVGKEGNKYRGMVADETYCWMILCDSPNVVRWNRRSGEVVEFSTFPEGFEAGTVPFKNIIDMGSFFYVVPFHANRICKLEKNTGAISFADFNLPYEETSFVSEYFATAGIYYEFAKKISETEIAACALYDQSIIVLDVEKNTYRKNPIRLKERLVTEVEKKNATTLQSVRENSEIPLNKYLKYLEEDLLTVRLRRGIPKRKQEEVQAGVDIHRMVKESLIASI